MGCLHHYLYFIYYYLIKKPVKINFIINNLEIIRYYLYVYFYNNYYLI